MTQRKDHLNFPRRFSIDRERGIRKASWSGWKIIAKKEISQFMQLTRKGTPIRNQVFFQRRVSKEERGVTIKGLMTGPRNINFLIWEKFSCCRVASRIKMRKESKEGSLPRGQESGFKKSNRKRTSPLNREGKWEKADLQGSRLD